MGLTDSAAARPQVRDLVRSLAPEFMQAALLNRVWHARRGRRIPIQASPANSPLSEFEFSTFSQNGEDGIIQHLISRLISPTSTVVEFGFGLTEGNSLRLIAEEGYGGLLIDSDDKKCRIFNKAAAKARFGAVKAEAHFLTAETVQAVILGSGIQAEIDLLSIDVDGNDFWLWKQIELVRPAIVVIEYNASLGPTVSLTIPYDPRFSRLESHPTGLYHGASLTALTRLAVGKGYGLLGCDSRGLNAFFVRNELFGDDLRVLSPEEAYRPHGSRSAMVSAEDQLALLLELPFLEID